MRSRVLRAALSVMRTRSLVALLAIGWSPATSAQVPPPSPNPGSACFDLSVEIGAEVSRPAFVEFIFTPSVSPDEARSQDRELRGPIRADSAILWWPARADSIGAYWVVGEGVLWEMRLDARAETMHGWMRQVLPVPDRPDTLGVRAVPRDCRPVES